MNRLKHILEWLRKCYFGFPSLQIFKENVVHQLNTIDFLLQSMI